MDNSFRPTGFSMFLYNINIQLSMEIWQYLEHHDE